MGNNTLRPCAHYLFVNQENSQDGSIIMALQLVQNFILLEY